MLKSSNQLNLYLLKIDSDFSDLIRGQYALNPSGQEKLSRRTSILAGKQFTASRALLSYILAMDWSTLTPGLTIDDSISPPIISNDNKLRLSLSHSGDYVAAVISTNRIALDIECVKGDRDYLNLARNAFHPSEVFILEQSDSRQALQERFYKFWTLRECSYKIGILGSLTDQNFDLEKELKERGLNPFFYVKDNAYLGLISDIPANPSLKFILQLMQTDMPFKFVKEKSKV